MNTYLISIFSNRLVEDEIDKIIKGKNNVIYFNYDDTDIDNIIEECAYFSLLNDEKIVIVRNFKLNSASKALDKYLDNINPNTRLVLLVNNIDKRSSLYKRIKKEGTVIEITELKPNELINKVNNYCKSINVKIDYVALQELISFNINNYDLILNDIDKISIVTNNITHEDVIKFAFKLDEEDNFGFSDAIISKKYDSILSGYNLFTRKKQEVIPFLALLASQFRIILAVKEIKENDDFIAKTLNIHPYRVKLAREKSYNYSKDDILNVLLLLCDLDKNLKSLNVNQYSLLESFLINFLAI